MPSDLKVTIEKIKKIEDHPNADRLELATVLGWQVCVQKDSFKVGDLVVYFPIDSILPGDIEARIFGPNSKIKLSKSRVRTIKLRGAISQGMVVPFTLFAEKLGMLKTYVVGGDVTKTLGVTKHVVQQRSSGMGDLKQRRKRDHHPDFSKYTKINHFENYDKVLEESGSILVVTEKVHGTNFRCGWLKRQPKNLWDHMIKWASENTRWTGLWDKWEFVYGSHNVQLQDRSDDHAGYYKSNVYFDAVKKYNLKTRLREIVEEYGESIVLYGEVYGEGIQKNYSYSVPSDSKELVVFDVKLDGSYVSWAGVRDISLDLRVPHVPVLRMGMAEEVIKDLDGLRRGPSVVDTNLKVKEGVVVRTFEETENYSGRGVFKYLNPDYLLLKGNTEWS